MNVPPSNTRAVLLNGLYSSKMHMLFCSIGKAKNKIPNHLPAPVLRSVAVRLGLALSCSTSSRTDAGFQTRFPTYIFLTCWNQSACSRSPLGGCTSKGHSHFSSNLRASSPRNSLYCGKGHDKSGSTHTWSSTRRTVSEFVVERQGLSSGHV